MNREFKLETKYIAVKEYRDNAAVFHDPPEEVFASDRVSAMTQFDLNNVDYVDVRPYVDESQLDLFDHE